MQNYPTEHKDIVNNLLEGKFLIYPNQLFVAIKKQEDEYIEFFEKSFGYELIVDAEFAYLLSNESKEKRSRDFTLFLALLCRELDYNGKNFRDSVELASFDIEETEQLLKRSSKWEILEKTSVANFEQFLSDWEKKNLLKRTGNQFKFTKAVKLFLEFAIEIAKAKMKEQNKI
jgi:hypothetical protein